MKISDEIQFSKRIVARTESGQLRYMHEISICILAAELTTYVLDWCLCFGSKAHYSLLITSTYANTVQWEYRKPLKNVNPLQIAWYNYNFVLPNL